MGWALACFGFLSLACGLNQPPAPEVQLSGGQIFEAAKPAVVIVEMVNSVRWSVPQAQFDPGKQSQLTDKLTAMIRAGTVQRTQDAVNRATVEIITDDPGSWLSVGGQRQEHTDVVYSHGSGFFFTEDGYLLTNAHVVQKTQDDIKKVLIGDFGPDNVDAASVQAVREDLSQEFQTQVSDQQAAKLARWLAGVWVAGLQIGSVTPSYRIAFGSHTAKEVGDSGLPVRLVVQGEPVPGKDVAVLKADGGPYVTLPLADGSPSHGSHLEVIGYPCGCRDEHDSDPARTLVPVLTEGSVRGELPMPSGWWATGTDARMQHGNSGGPVLDRYGRVVGLATFGNVQETSPQNFVLPVAVTREFTRQAGARPRQGRLGKSYTSAVLEYSQHHYRAALPLFQQVAAVDRQDPYVGIYVDQSRAAIAAGRDRTPPPTPGAVVWLERNRTSLLSVLWLLLGLAASGLVARGLMRRRPA